MHGAWARLSQARAIATREGAPRWPRLQLEAQSQKQKSFLSAFNRSFESTQHSVSLAASYELDIWGRLTHQAKAAHLEERAVRDDVEGLAISLTAEVAETWFDLLSQRARHDLLNAQLETNETFLELVTLRFDEGLASALDVYQQRQVLITARTQLASNGAQLAVTQNRLAVLLGRAPGQQKYEIKGTLPKLPPLPSPGVPADLLDRRPDVRAARRRLESSDHRINVALGAMLPSLRLTGSAGYTSPTLRDFAFDQLIWNVLANITAPLFEGGARKAEYDRSKAVVEERASQYGQIVLQALGEVENAIAQDHFQHEQIGHIQEQLDNAKNTLREARERYLHGLNDYLPVLNALQSLHNAEQNLLSAQRQLLSTRIQLCRALGGAWTKDIERPTHGNDSQESDDMT
jgi:NodT family efflux transporter outer membrane factor (OMF) lipoprotein